MNRTSKRILAVGLPLVTVVATGAAVAFFSGSGSGTGTASSSTGVTNLLVAQTSTLSGLAPGVAAKAVTGTITNTSGEAAYVTSVEAAIASVTKAAGAVAGTCDASDYALSNPVMTVTTDIAPGAVTAFSGASIAFVNKATSQDACKGATVNLTYTAS